MLQKLSKIIAVSMAVVVSVNAYANGDSSAPKSKHHLEQNNPAIGSEQGSNMLFGNPTGGGKKGEKYYTKQQLSPKNRVNKPAIGSEQGSNMLFGNPTGNGKKGEKYYTKQQLSPENRLNKPAIGSKQGSNELFGNNGSPQDKTSSDKLLEVQQTNPVQHQ